MVRRIRAALAPATFFVGLTLTCGSLIEFQRWPAFIERIHQSDFEYDVTRWQPELSDWLMRALGFTFEPRPTPIVAFGVLNASALALVGLPVRRRVGGTMLVVGAVSGSLFLLLGALTQFGNIYDVGCDPWVPPMTAAFGALIAVLMTGWALLEHQPFSLAPSTLAAAGVSALMIAVTIAYAGAAGTRYPVAPDWPVLPLAALLFCGFGVSFAQPRFSSPLASLLVLLAGVALTVPAIAIAHDERIVIHAGPMLSSTQITTVPADNCGLPRLAPVIQVYATEVVISGSVMGTPAQGTAIEETVHEKLVELRKAFNDLHLQAGDPDAFEGRINLHADATMPMATFEAINRACWRAGYTKIAIIALPEWPIAVWTRPLRHRHVCALEIVIADDGTPLSDFAAWPSLVRAADRAEGKLRISAK